MNDDAGEYDTVEFSRYEEGEYKGAEWNSKRRYKRVRNVYPTPPHWVDEESGLVTEDPRKFEAWLDSLSKIE